MVVADRPARGPHTLASEPHNHNLFLDAVPESHLCCF